MKQYDAVAFDLDGTLMCSHPGIVRSAGYALTQLGYTYDEDTLMKFIGPPLFNSFVDYFGMDEGTAVRAVQLYRERFSDIGWKENAVYPGIPRLLRTLKNHGVFLALCSAKPIHFAKKIIEYFGMGDLFDVISCNTPNNERLSEDKADLLRGALPPEYTCAVMVGDRKYDITAAHDVGVDSIGVSFGYGTREELQACHPTHIVDSVAALYAQLCGDTPPSRGVFITLEGCEAVGKSTQCALMRTYLEDCGYEVVVTREPGGCPISESVRELLLNPLNKGMSAETEMLLYAAARAQHVSEVIEPALVRGAAVLCDRYLDSSLAYQAYGRQLGVPAVMAANAPALATMPDVTILLDMDVIKARSRRKRTLDRIEAEQLSFHVRVREGYLDIAKGACERVYIMNARDTKDVIFDKIRMNVQRALGNARQNV